jgi:hypothetical protein
VQIDKFQRLHFFKIEMNFTISLKQGKNGIIGDIITQLHHFMEMYQLPRDRRTRGAKGLQLVEL